MKILRVGNAFVPAILKPHGVHYILDKGVLVKPTALSQVLMIMLNMGWSNFS